VKFDHYSTQSFTKQGIYNIGMHKPMLFWDEIKFDIPSKPVEVPPNDTLVAVRYLDAPQHVTQFRYSTGKLDNAGRLICWDSGRTSRTVSGNTDTCSWGLWEVVV